MSVAASCTLAWKGPFSSFSSTEFSLRRDVKSVRPKNHLWISGHAQIRETEESSSVMSASKATKLCQHRAGLALVLSGGPVHSRHFRGKFQTMPKIADAKKIQLASCLLLEVFQFIRILVHLHFTSKFVDGRRYWC